jgi:hypothetical protein
LYFVVRTEYCVLRIVVWIEARYERKTVLVQVVMNCGMSQWGGELKACSPHCLRVGKFGEQGDTLTSSAGGPFCGRLRSVCKEDLQYALETTWSASRPPGFCPSAASNYIPVLRTGSSCPDDVSTVVA